MSITLELASMFADMYNPEYIVSDLHTIKPFKVNFKKQGKRYASLKFRSNRRKTLR
jgi:hypothetical protein